MRPRLQREMEKCSLVGYVRGGECTPSREINTYFLSSGYVYEGPRAIPRIRLARVLYHLYHCRTHKSVLMTFQVVDRFVRLNGSSAVASP